MHVCQDGEGEGRRVGGTRMGGKRLTPLKMRSPDEKLGRRKASSQIASCGKVEQGAEVGGRQLIFHLKCLFVLQLMRIEAWDFNLNLNPCF